MKVLNDTVFISTNYDILIDNALGALNIDYGIDFTNKRTNKIKLFKIHGSLNWLYCPTCNTITITPYEKGALILYEDIGRKCECGVCQSVLAPVIVPPTYYKNFSNVFLSVILYKIEQALKSVEHIIFCGYSFPDADMHIKYLLKRVQQNGHVKDLKVTVINGFKGKTKETKEEEKNRYTRFLGNIVNYNSLVSFENFANHPEKYII